MRFSALVPAALERHAFALLRDEALSVSEVALRLGYADVAHFSRAFRRWSAFSPRAWRRLSREN